MMRVRTLVLSALALATVAVPAGAAEDVWVADVLGNPARYWNVEVTITGQVMAVTANPAGTTRGVYTLGDDSSTVGLVVRTSDLPPLGRAFRVTGIVLQDPAQPAVPVMNERRRRPPGATPLLTYSLIAAAVLLLVLLVVLVTLLLRPPARAARTAASATPAAPGPPPSKAPASALKTRKISLPPPPHEAAKTRIFTNLGAELRIERGPDRDKSHVLHKPVTTIGRAGARKNDVELTDDTVSKEQASIYFDAETGGFSIANESRTNPTMVDKKVVGEPRALARDALIEMGGTAMRFKQG